ncbi:hypothetical protein GDO86_008451 [Hymenochirus boettgeri]|uniref:Bromo domain-containing protein n=1 Tax=Hymenochirus boettgeri TaxID=247094 RepID=A0A8T2J5T6_9PIPI|nr:hypothetical protein GDO86_008451 [Hymenochirus boettgeri]
MGKKHKKHKGEKHGYEGKGDMRGAEYVEKPLKLVLKVGTGEVKELSTARAAAVVQDFHDNKTDHDKHKDKKKKKKKKAEKVLVPNEEKKKKKDDKKKKDKNQHENLANKESKINLPIRADVSAVPLLESSLSKPEEEQTPLQEALNQLIRQLQRKDPGAFFSFPVTDFIAPGYSMIIKNPMDFSTMKEKIRNHEYESIEEFKENFKQICQNAMIYNKPGTIYYKAAKKLLNSGMKILSQERIHSLKQSIDFMADLHNGDKEKGDVESNGERTHEPLKDDSMDTDDIVGFRSPMKDLKRKDKDLQEDKQKLSEGAAEKEQELIEQLIRESSGKLSKRVINSQFEFERRKPDGTTTLALLNPGDSNSGEPGQCSATIGAMSNRVQAGVNCLQGFKEDKRNKVTPVLYMNYGPFTSYAPCYDSTFANVGKDDSDLIYSTYGEEPSHQGTFSIQEFLESTMDKSYGMADCLLDVFTDGAHSRTQIEQNKLGASAAPARQDCINAQDQFACLKTVFGLEIFDETFESEETERIQRKLDETTKLLQELQQAQNERLSTKPPPNTVCLLAPSAKEIQIAEHVNENLKVLAQQVHPGDIVSIQGIRKAMGISHPFLDLVEPVNHLSEGDAEHTIIISRPVAGCPLPGT